MTNSIYIQIVDSPSEAPNYALNHPEVRSALITKAIVVCNGTKSGNPTVDLQFTAQDGTQYVGMITGELIKQLAGVIEHSCDRHPIAPSGVIQAFWMEIANTDNVKFIAQGGPFSDSKLVSKWINETFNQHKEERQDGWTPMVCDEHSRHFIKQPVSG